MGGGGAIFHANSIKFCPPILHEYPWWGHFFHGGGIFSCNRTIIFSTAPGRRCFMAWKACNIRPSAAAWGVLSA